MDLSIIGIDGVAAVLLTGCVIGAVELVKALFDKDWRRAVTILISAIIGGAVSPLIGVALIPGVVGGLAASGIITLVQNLGKDSF